MVNTLNTLGHEIKQTTKSLLFTEGKIHLFGLLRHHYIHKTLNFYYVQICKIC